MQAWRIPAIDPRLAGLADFCRAFPMLGEMLISDVIPLYLDAYEKAEAAAKDYKGAQKRAEEN
jgi:hypothetical protein